MHKIFILTLILFVNFSMSAMNSSNRLTESAPTSSDFRDNIHVRPKALRDVFLSKKFDETGVPLTEFARKLKIDARSGPVYVALPPTIQNKLHNFLVWFLKKFDELTDDLADNQLWC